MVFISSYYYTRLCCLPVDREKVDGRHTAKKQHRGHRASCVCPPGGHQNNSFDSFSAQKQPYSRGLQTFSFILSAFFSLLFWSIRSMREGKPFYPPPPRPPPFDIHLRRWCFDLFSLLFFFFLPRSYIAPCKNAGLTFFFSVRFYFRVPNNFWPRLLPFYAATDCIMKYNKILSPGIDQQDYVQAPSSPPSLPV